MVLVSNKLYAQTTFFTVYQPNQVTMTAAQSVRYNLLLNDTTISQLSIVSTADVRSFLANDTLAFQLPGPNTNVSAVAQRIEESTASGYTWSASLVNNLGYLSFIYQNNQTFGFIQIGQDFYELYPMNENYEFLVKKDLNPLVDCGMATHRHRLAPTRLNAMSSRLVFWNTTHARPLSQYCWLSLKAPKTGY